MLLIVAVALLLPRSGGDTPRSEIEPMNKVDPTNNVVATEPIAPSIRTRPQAEQLAAAFRAAFGRDGRAAATVEGSQLTFRPGRILWVGDRAILISPGKNRSDCHACAGALAIHYLRPFRDAFEVVGAWPGAVRGWGWGEPPTDWSISNRFASNPVLVAEGGFMGQGIVCSSATLTELSPEGPIESAIIRTGYSNGGAITDERLAEGERAEELDGEITNIQRDRSFDVRFTGTARFTERYVRRGNRFVPVAASRLPC
jgi:hypothetical protein